MESEAEGCMTQEALKSYLKEIEIEQVFSDAWDSGFALGIALGGGAGITAALFMGLLGS